MNKMIETILGKNSKIPPIWFMRQAGRYLPEYRKIKSDKKDFLSMCYDSNTAMEITLQPIKRFDLDAAIIFADILLILHNLGVGLSFEKNKGPIVEKITDIKRAKNFNDSGKLNHVYKAISLVKQSLKNSKALIGFAGSPWTVVTYLLEGNNKKDFIFSRSKICKEKKLIDYLIKRITEETIIYLKNQIKSGVDIIQLFDSWSGVLSEEDFKEYVINPTKIILYEIKQEFPHIPIIGFPKGAGYRYDEYIDTIKPDVIGVDYMVPISKMIEFQEKTVVQGNLDPVILLGNKKLIEKNVNKLMDNLQKKPFIFNLGHGILPETPIENVEFIISIIRNYEEK